MSKDADASDAPMKLIKNLKRNCIHGPCDDDMAREMRVPMGWRELWCLDAEKSVVDLSRCPMGYWKKNEKGRLF